MLLLLAETPTYGYDLLERLKTFGFPRDPGGTYRILHALEHDRLIRVRTLPSAAGPDRLVYHVTKMGRHELDESALRLRSTRTEVGRFLHRHATLASAPRDRER